MNETFEVELKSGSFSLRAKGFKAAGQISQYAVDAIGVIGEPIGYLKDSFKNFRMHRAEAVAAAMIRAKQIAEDSGRGLPRVPAKNLAGWIEGASLEDLEGDNLLELWARLLAASPADFDPMQSVYADVLKKIGPREAGLLKDLVCKQSLEDVFYNEENVENHAFIELKKHFQEVFPNVLLHSGGGFIESLLNQYSEGVPNLPLTVYYRIVSDYPPEPRENRMFDKSLKQALVVLTREGVLARRVFPYVSHGEEGMVGSIRVELYQMTDVGIEFSRFLGLHDEQ